MANRRRSLGVLGGLAASQTHVEAILHRIRPPWLPVERRPVWSLFSAVSHCCGRCAPPLMSPAASASLAGVARCVDIDRWMCVTSPDTVEPRIFFSFPPSPTKGLLHGIPSSGLLFSLGHVLLIGSTGRWRLGRREGKKGKQETVEIADSYLRSSRSCLLCPEALARPSL